MRPLALLLALVAILLVPACASSRDVVLEPAASGHVDVGPAAAPWTAGARVTAGRYTLPGASVAAPPGASWKPEPAVADPAAAPAPTPVPPVADPCGGGACVISPPAPTEGTAPANPQ